MALQLANGQMRFEPLKAWLRSNPGQLPAGVSTEDKTSHQLRSILRRQGWQVEFLPEEVRLTKSGTVFSEEQIATASDDESFIEDEREEDFETRFSLESQLRDFISGNLPRIPINGRYLKLFVDANGVDGVEYQVGVGRIDILALDSDGSFYVFELKRAESSDRVLGQLTRYMGWLKKTIAADREVYGVIVSKEIGSNLRYAVSVVPNVFLFEYAIQFTLNEAHQLPS
ncbi:endonuclease NucS domain-containing protein [Rhizobium oryziradicis]|uniref:endonuclease NucS domain-containing protein n=1 Tax=Rhizobium oryziradicis TaxID=1867956 RepID=UPI0015882780|nr:endonuclease NucS domain-containing protein [Rhizobium oryziradicis]